MTFGVTILQAAFEYGAGSGLTAQLPQLARRVTNFASDNWLVLLGVVVVLFFLTRPFRRPG